MENYRKRQQRLAERRILEEREQLLRAFLPVADDLERALNANKVGLESLREGVELTHQTLMQILDQEGVKRIQAIGRPFDPTWHEAVGTVPHQKAEIEPGMVAVVVQEGYRLGDRLLRPARVVVTN
jgi:molecular chaperone GrpE